MIVRHERMQDLEDPARPMGPDALLKSIGKKQRHRTGYEAGASMIARTVTAAEFVRSADPMPTLASVRAILMQVPDAEASDGEAAEGEGEGEGDATARLSAEEATAMIVEHAETDTEVRALCADVQVLGRSEFKHLLRWRMKMRKALERMEKERAQGAPAEVCGCTTRLRCMHASCCCRCVRHHRAFGGGSGVCSFRESGRTQHAAV